MEYRKINDNAVQCIITKEDMDGFGLSIVDIFERNEKGEQFLHEVIRSALEEVGCEMNGGNIALQISPTQDKGLVITFSDAGPSALVDLLEHLKSAFATSGADFQKMMEQMQREGHRGNEGQEQGAPVWSKEERKAQQQIRVFAFYNLSDLLSFSQIAFGEKKMGSSLYKVSDLYYLVLQKKRLSQKDFNKLSTQCVEFGDPVRMGYQQLEWLEEHGECLISSQAIGKLKKIS